MEPKVTKETLRRMKAMKTEFGKILICGLLLTSGAVQAQSGRASVQQHITIEVRPITAISVTGNPQALIIKEIPTGKNYTTVTDENTSYSVLTNRENMRIVASINQPMPFGTKLMIDLESSKGMSAGMVDISEALTPVTAVSGVGHGSDRQKTIRYSFAANSNAGDIGMDSRIVTLTVTD